MELDFTDRMINVILKCVLVQEGLEPVQITSQEDTEIHKG